MGDQMGAAGGGTLRLQTLARDGSIGVAIRTDAIPLPDGGFSLPLCPTVLAGCGGTVRQVQEGPDAVVHIEIPVENPS